MTRVRPATEADAPELLEIYRPYVEQTAISFETELPSVEQFAGRIAKYAQTWDWVVAEDAGTCVGYAYGSAHRERAAYRWSVETSVYVHERSPSPRHRHAASTPSCLNGCRRRAIATRSPALRCPTTRAWRCMNGSVSK